MAYKQECSTKAKRAAMADQLKALADRLDVTFEAKPALCNEAHGLTWRMGLGEYRVFGYLAGNSGVGAFLGHWHVATGRDSRYPRHFDRRIRGSVNQFHWRKATICAETFADLMQDLEAGFGCLREEGLANG